MSRFKCLLRRTSLKGARNILINDFRNRFRVRGVYLPQFQPRTLEKSGKSRHFISSELPSGLAWLDFFRSVHFLRLDVDKLGMEDS